MFERVQLVRADDDALEPLRGYRGDSTAAVDPDLPVGAGKQHFLLVPILRASAIDDELEPIRPTLALPDANLATGQNAHHGVATLEPSNCFQQWPPSREST